MASVSSNPINMAKTLVYGVKHFVEKRKQESLIRDFDTRTPYQCVSPLESLGRCGWSQTDSDTVFGQSVAGLVMTNEMQWLPEPDIMGNALTRRVSEETLRVVLQSKVLIEVVRGYLGDGARLDDLYLWKKDYCVQKRFDISEGWHTDNVGNRLKMFIGVQASGEAPRTLLIQGGHKRPYKVSVSELFRFFGHTELPKGEVVEISYQPDTVALFDTNTLHRGHYRATEASRTCLVLEFIDRRKGNLLSGVCPCGPGQSPQGCLHLPLALSPMLAQHPLIDQALMRDEADHVSYSISNMYN